MKIVEGVPVSGVFEIDNKNIAGEITFATRKTKLFVHHPDFFCPDANLDQCVLGILNDRTRVSLLNCNLPQIPGTSFRRDESYNFAEIFPHYILSGERHLRPNEKIIQSIHVVTDDLHSIFYDFDAFSHVLESENFIKLLTQSNEKVGKRKIEIGKFPQIAYYTGKTEIFRATTNLGTISATWSEPRQTGHAAG